MSEAPLIRPVILAGGLGSRLWPLSSSEKPKHFQPLLSERSMLQETVQRVRDPQRYREPIIVSNQAHAAETARHLQEIGAAARVLLEPFGRSTAPAIALAALDLVARGRGDDVTLVLPADHLIRDVQTFSDAVDAGAELARAGQIVTIGIEPTSPNTGYGYIRRGAPIPAIGVRAFAISSFHEKPDLPSARQYLISGDYLWNAGIFVFRATDLISELSIHCPAILEAMRAALARADQHPGGLVAGLEDYRLCPAGSFDVCVMERTSRGAVVPAAMGWSDVGSWDALWHIAEKDTGGNVVTGDVTAVDSTGCYIRADGATVAAIGLENLVVVAAGHTILIARRDAADQVRVLHDVLSMRRAAPPDD